MGKVTKIWNPSNFRRAYLYLKKNGLKNTWYAAVERTHDKNNDSYVYEALSKDDIEKQRKQAEKLKQESSVCFSVFVPAYETKREFLWALLASMQAQTYDAWELVIADASRSEIVSDTVAQFGEKYPKTAAKIRYIRLSGNQGIAANSNAALPKLTGAYTGLLDHDDVLTPDALYEMARAIRETQRAGKEAVLLYSDEDKMDGLGTRYYEPHKKLEFNYDLILSNNYICHFLVMQTDVMQRLQFRSLYDGAQDYDLILRGIDEVERLRGQGVLAEIVHVPKVLYHWRCHEGSTADNPASKMYAYEAGRKAVFDYCQRKGYPVFLHHARHLGFYRIAYERDIFRIRKDIGAIGGRVLYKNKIFAGAYQEDGSVLYEGLNSRFSGYMHRAVLCQNVDAVDVRCLRLRRELMPFLTDTVKETLGGSHPFWEAIKKAEPEGLSDTFIAASRTGMLSEQQLRDISLRLGTGIRAAGYRILWDPDISISLTELPRRHAWKKGKVR